MSITCRERRQLPCQLAKTIAANAVLDARVKELEGHLTDTEVATQKELQV